MRSFEGLYDQIINGTYGNDASIFVISIIVRGLIGYRLKTSRLWRYDHSPAAPLR